MRLIDADELIEHLRKDPLFDLVERYGIVGVIESRPTVEPIKHGHWLYTEAWPHRVYCSVCYRTYALRHWQIWEDGSLSRAYCPSCGAKMDGGDENEAD